LSGTTKNHCGEILLHKSDLCLGKDATKTFLRMHDVYDLGIRFCPGRNACMS
jgi:hypothetical protein